MTVKAYFDGGCQPTPPAPEDDPAERVVSYAMQAAKDAHARWMADEAFVEWCMHHISASREEVLGTRCGMLDTYMGWLAGREHGRHESAAYLDSVAGAGDKVDEVLTETLRGMAAVLRCPGANLPKPTS